MTAIDVESEAALVARARGGDRAAFGALAARHSKALAAFAARRLGDPVEANDVAQATLVRALESLDTLREPARFRGWLWGIALNECRQRQRALARLARALERWREGRPASALPFELGEDVRQALAALPERQRLAVELRVFDGLSCEDAATALGVTAGTIKANFHHALVKLRGRLA